MEGAIGQDRETVLAGSALTRPGERGSIHCSRDGFPYMIPSLLDWLADRVGAAAGGGG
jgi:hypothetical protein